MLGRGPARTIAAFPRSLASERRRAAPVSSGQERPLQISEGVYQLLTPFPKFDYEEAMRIRGELERKPRVTKGLP